MMPRIRRILFASDFSKASTKAFTTAVTLAKASGSTLTILHVLAPLTPIMPEQYIGDQTWEQIDLERRQWAKREFAKLAEKAKKAAFAPRSFSSKANRRGTLSARPDPRTPIFWSSAHTAGLG
jgi:nucleotide-binding universal stress UspA family protein